MSNPSESEIDLAPLLQRPSMFSVEALAKLDHEMHAAEVDVSALSKLTAVTMCEEIRKKLDRMQELSTNMPANWPEFATLAASIRGYAFNAFHICHAIADRQWGKEARHQPKPKPTIEDLLSF